MKIALVASRSSFSSLRRARRHGRARRRRHRRRGGAVPLRRMGRAAQKYVDGKGRVDYAAIDRAAFDKVFAAVAASSPKKSRTSTRPPPPSKAYYLDAYNVCVWKNVSSRLPKLKNVDSEKASFFYFTRFVVGGKEMNLSGSGERRSCARVQRCARALRAQLRLGRLSRSFRPTRSSPARVDEQLTREARKFVNEKRNVDFDAAARSSSCRTSSIGTRKTSAGEPTR